jgi:heme/copper-type cytochrome/quinol oxidase subunit 4
MNPLTIKKIVAIVVNVFLAVLLFWLLVNCPEATVLTTAVLWLLAVTCIGSLLYFLYWVPGK